MSTENKNVTLPHQHGKKFKNDLIFLAVLLSVILVAGLGVLLFRGAGDSVTVTVDGKLWAEYPLNEDREIEIKTERGVNLLVIKDGKAEIVRASCPDGICSDHRPINRDGESIICLPNKVVVTVRATRGDAPDVIS
ncbi:MAG: NusG domain II-containing protein [Clostridia bacterium]|nr:NusG domain II-containing protein [Clostridia bacterium]